LALDFQAAFVRNRHIAGMLWFYLQQREYAMDSTPSSHPCSTAIADRDFKQMLAGVIPQLRAFARGLCGERDLADDLVQETMLKAWSARTVFQAGTNFRAWTFTILRNHYFSLQRRKRFVGEWDDLVADRLLCAPAAQNDVVELRDMLRALQQLPPEQREALILVAAGGISYEETARITGVATGTAKSRVSRARTALEALVQDGRLAQSRSEFAETDDPVVSIFAYIESIKGRYGAVPEVHRFGALAA
jgi:RNA polymerase sigma factor (sigma-70 family)